MYLFICRLQFMCIPIKLGDGLESLLHFHLIFSLQTLSRAQSSIFVKPSMRKINLERTNSCEKYIVYIEQFNLTIYCKCNAYVQFMESIKSMSLYILQFLLYFYHWAVFRFIFSQQFYFHKFCPNDQHNCTSKCSSFHSFI